MSTKGYLGTGVLVRWSVGSNCAEGRMMDEIDAGVEVLQKELLDAQKRRRDAQSDVKRQESALSDAQAVLAIHAQWETEIRTAIARLKNA